MKHKRSCHLLLPPGSPLVVWMDLSFDLQLSTNLHVGLHYVGECWLGFERSHGPLIHEVIQNIGVHHPSNDKNYGNV